MLKFFSRGGRDIQEAITDVEEFSFAEGATAVGALGLPGGSIISGVALKDDSQKTKVLRDLRFIRDRLKTIKKSGIK